MQIARVIGDFVPMPSLASALLYASFALEDQLFSRSLRAVGQSLRAVDHFLKPFAQSHRCYVQRPARGARCYVNATRLGTRAAHKT